MLFGAPVIDLSELELLEAQTPNLIVWAVPAMVFFTLVEILFSYLGNRGFYEKKELTGSILVGFGNLIVSAVLKVFLLLVVVWVYNQFPCSLS